jgi:hypothetical protein
MQMRKKKLYIQKKSDCVGQKNILFYSWKINKLTIKECVLQIMLTHIEWMIFSYIKYFSSQQADSTWITPISNNHKSDDAIEISLHYKKERLTIN